MITCLVIGDPHFKINNVRETQLMHAKICEIARARKPTFIVCLGDVLDRHETIHVSPLERASAFLHELSTIAPLYRADWKSRSSQQFEFSDDRTSLQCTQILGKYSRRRYGSDRHYQWT